MKKTGKYSNMEETQNKKWRYHLLGYFTDIIQSEQNLDSLRQTLSQQNNFSIENLFNYLDNENKGYITLEDFIKFLSANSIEFEEKCLRLLIHFYDKNNDFVLNYDEFKFIVSDNEEQKNNNNQELDENILRLFCDILVQEIELCKKCCENAKNCFDSRHFTIYEGFVEIAEEKEYITYEDLWKFFDENGIKLDEKCIKRIIYRLDSDNDGKVSFVEFNNVFFPPSFHQENNYSEYKYKLKDFNNNKFKNNSINNKKINNNNNKKVQNNKNININKSSEIQDNTLLKSNDKSPICYNYNNKSIDFNHLDFKHGFSENPRLKYTSRVLNYNYSRYPDVEIDKYKLDKEYNSLKNSLNLDNKNENDNKENVYSNDITMKKCPLNHYFVFCHCCGCCCELCCH